MFTLFSKKKRSSLYDELAIRDTMSKMLGYMSVLPDPDPILQKTGKSIEVYRDLISDAHVFANIQQRKSGTASLKSRIIAPEHSESIKTVFSQVVSSIDIGKLIHQILDAPMFGYSVLEVIWKKENGLVIPEQIEEKPQEWFSFDMNNKLLFRNYRHDEIILPDYKFLLVQSKSSYLNPYGEKALARCFWPVTFKRSGLQYWVLFTEKYGIPFLVAKQPRSYTEADSSVLLQALDKMMQDTYAVIPDDSSVSFTDGSRAYTSDVFKKLLEFCNNEISKALLSQTLTTEVQSKGTYAASQTHKEMLANLIKQDTRLVEKTINQLFQWIWKLNFDSITPGTAPIFELFDEAETNKHIADRDLILNKQGIKLSKEYYKRVYNLSDGDFI